MSTGETCYTFGPVPSRRLGKSLGINNIPAKHCTYACLYCQVGPTTKLMANRCPFHAPEQMVEEVRTRLEQLHVQQEPVDYLTFVPDGEPTLDSRLGETISQLKSLGPPVGVITNSSLLWREEVQEALSQVDWISVKVDAVDKTVWRRINCPHPTMELERILDGIRAFNRSFSGILVTETMLVQGLNDQDSCMRHVARFLEEIKPQCAYLSIPTRPPMDSSVRAPDETTLNRIYQLLEERLDRVEYLIGYEGDDFASTGNAERDLLSITAVHPMRAEAVQALLARTEASWQVVDRLLQRGDLAVAFYEGHTFYLRRFSRNKGGSA
nr:radical SAM protein [uncultured Desulfobulbus sp.]